MANRIGLSHHIDVMQSGKRVSGRAQNFFLTGLLDDQSQSGKGGFMSRKPIKMRVVLDGQWWCANWLERKVCWVGFSEVWRNLFDG